MKNNNYMCHVPYIRKSIAYDHGFWYTCVKLWYLQKWPMMTKKSVAVDISGTICHMIVIYGTLVYNDDICRVFFIFYFFIFSKFWFFGLFRWVGRRGRDKRAENGKNPKWERNLSVMLHISGIIHHMIFINNTHL